MTTTIATSFPVLSFAAVRERLIARDETALLDVREEDPFAQEHPLWAANLPLSRIEIEAWRRIPRRDTLIVLYGEHARTDLAPQAARTLAALGYTNVHLLEGGLTQVEEAAVADHGRLGHIAAGRVDQNIDRSPLLQRLVARRRQLSLVEHIGRQR